MVAPPPRLPHLGEHKSLLQRFLRASGAPRGSARTLRPVGAAKKKETPMARKPNYSFERQERDRADAKKAAEKAAAKAEKRAAAAARKEAGLPPLEDE